MAATSSNVNDIVLKSCEIENCQRISAIPCPHCNKNVCRPHFNEHADQLLQELNPFGDSLNELGEKISSFGIKEFKQRALDKLTQWRDGYIQKFNDIFELKKQQLDLLLQDNEELFLQRTTNHLEVLNTLKNETTTLVQEGEVTFEQLQILKRKLCAFPVNNYMRGGTLLCADHQMKLNDFYGNAQQKWELIYKATWDGIRGQDFHRCCDNKGPTMTIIQSKNDNYLFGGYTEVSWTCDGKYKTDPAAFLFTLTNPHDIPPTKFLRNPQEINSVGHNETIGPYFGGVVKDKKHFIDIQIWNNANKQYSTCSFPSSYLDTTGIGATLFTGTKNFMVNEIEVYTRLVGADDAEDDQSETG